MSVREHPEDLGRIQAGEPASVWQLPETREVFGGSECFTAAWHRCQLDLDASKPTRLFSDIPGILDFGLAGWPMFDAARCYVRPSPRCGHKHKMKQIGQSKKGGFNTSPTAAYSPKMCNFLARVIFEDWIRHQPQGTRKSPCGLGDS